MRLAGFVTLFIFLSAVDAYAAPGTIDDCEKIEAPLAYNACLASFGPKRGQRHAPGLGQAHSPHASGPTPLGGVRRSFSGLPVRQIGRGRVRMEFSPRRRASQ